MYWGKICERIDPMTLCITTEFADLVAKKLWPTGCNTSLEVLEDLREYIESRYKALGCCVLYRHSSNFREFQAKHNLPDTEDREFIMHTDGTVRYSPDYRRTKFSLFFMIPQKMSNTAFFTPLHFH